MVNGSSYSYLFAHRRHPEPQIVKLFLFSSSRFWLRHGLIFIDKNAQSMTLSCHLKKPFIFQRILKKEVAGTDRNQQAKSHEAGSEGTHCPEGRHDKKSADPAAQEGQKKESQLNKQMLAPGVSEFVSPQEP